jgi:undecaprenyl-diphosphatase
MDRHLFALIRRVVGKAPWLDWLMVHVAEKGPLWFFAVMGVLALYGGFSERLAVGQAIAAATLTRLVNEGIGRLHHRERPFVREGFVPLVLHRPDFSFPSNHAACGFALAVAVLLTAPGSGAYIMLGLAVWLAFARVHVGVHYPSDVGVGALIGTAVAWATVRLTSGWIV